MVRYRYHVAVANKWIPSQKSIELRCTSVTRFGPDSWRFEFEGRTTLDVRCPWRIVAEGRIALGNADHEQQFGRPKQVDANLEAERLLVAPVANITINKKTADLVLQLEGGTCLDVYNSSSGYE